MTSCFFCQNLLSDFVEGILPAVRHEEIKKHLETCSDCRRAQDDLQGALRLLKAMPPRRLGSDTALRISEASQPGGVSRLSRATVSRWVLGISVPLLLFTGMLFTFPDFFPWFQALRSRKEEMQFARYYPLQQGAAEILEEQGTWLHSGETLMGSLWDEGGLSPEDFEKTFQVKSGRANRPEAMPPIEK